MCCRYFIDEEEPDFREVIAEMNHSPLISSWERKDLIADHGEVRPGNVAPVIASNRRGEQSVFPMQWGYSGKTLLINARSETAAEKPTFRRDWERHRCVVPASWYYEWEHIRGKNGKVRSAGKYRIQPQSPGLAWLCGLYRMEEGLPHFVVLTREPGESIRFIHDRMPLILPKDAADIWIRPDIKPKELLQRALTDMEYRVAE